MSDSEGLGDILYLFLAPGAYIIGTMWAMLIYLICMIPPILYWIVYLIVSAVKKKKETKMLKGDQL